MSEDLNATINETQTSNCPSNPTAENIGKFFAYCLIFLVSLAGNTVIGLIIYKTKTMRKPINFLIVNMAMSDLLFAIFIIPRDIQLLFIDSWLIGGSLGQALCKLVYLLLNVSAAVSIQSLVLIAVDRFGAVVYPLRSPLISSKLCPFFILATWIVAMAVGSPGLASVKLVEFPRGFVCLLHWKDVFRESSILENHYLTMAVVFAIIPLVLIAVLHIVIYIKLKSQKSPGEQSANTEQQRQQRERNVLKMAIAIVLGFALCWLPYVISAFLVAFGKHVISSCIFLYVFTVANLMVRASCAINPCICFVFSQNYRKGLQTLLR